MIKVAIISNQNTNPNIKNGNPVVVNLIEQLNKTKKIEVVGFTIRNFFPSCNQIINIARFDIVHVHFGGLYCLFIFLLFPFKTKIITFHGTDLHGSYGYKNFRSFIKKTINRLISLLCVILSNYVGLVSLSLKKYIICSFFFDKKIFHNQLGVDYEKFYPLNKNNCKKIFRLKDEKKYVLFSSISSSKVKRFDLAHEIVSKMGPSFELIQLSGIPYSEVVKYINACDALIITSDNEGSPNIVRECLACNIPVFSFNVGDLRYLSKKGKGVYIIDKEPFFAIKTIKSKLNLDIESRIEFEEIISISSVIEKQVDFYNNIYLV